MYFVANISTCQDGLRPRLSLKLHDLSPFLSITFMICVHNFPHGEVSVKVGIMEFGLKGTIGLYHASSLAMDLAACAKFSSSGLKCCEGDELPGSKPCLHILLHFFVYLLNLHAVADGNCQTCNLLLLMLYLILLLLLLLLLCRWYWCGWSWQSVEWSWWDQ